MIVDAELVRIGSANFSRRSMAVDTECDLAAMADGEATRAGILRIRNRLLAEHLGLTIEAVALGIERAGSVRALIDSRELAEHTLVRIELPPETEEPSEAARAVADPDEPIAFAVPVAGRVSLATFMAGTLAFLLALAGFAGLGALIRQTVREPTVRQALITIGAAILLAALGVVLRMLLRFRQFAPSVSRQRQRAEFG
jgi:hypothetical protein